MAPDTLRAADRKSRKVYRMPVTFEVQRVPSPRVSLALGPQKHDRALSYLHFPNCTWEHTGRPVGRV